MNQHLQAVLTTVQADKNLSEEEKNAIIKSLKSADKDFEISNFKLDRTEKVKRTTAILLEETIEELEQKRKAVEAQNKELEIETALERVRTVAMSMMKPDDLLGISKIQFNELKQLGFTELRNALIGIFNDGQAYFTDYDYSDFSGGSIAKIPYHKNKVVDNAIKRMKSSQDAFTEFIVEGEELEEWKAFRKANGEYDDTRITHTERLYYYFYSIESGNIGISNFEKINEAQLNILKRFRNVFDLAYKRYVDISKAEAQAREAQVEVAVERVRAQSMAMHQTTDLDKVNKEVYNQLQWLKVDGLSGVSIYFIDKEGEVTVWDLSSPGNIGDPNSYTFKFSSKKYPILGELWQHYKNPQDYFTLDYPLEKLKAAIPEFREIDNVMANAIEEAINNGSLTHQWNAFGRIDGGVLGIDLMNPPSEDTKTIVQKMAGAFNLAYKRFLDLKKAEAQAREAEIELALERVRARTMAMQHSDELAEASLLLDNQVRALGIRTRGCAFNIYADNDSTEWFSSEIGTMPTYKTPRENIFRHYYEEGKAGRTMYIETFEGEQCKAHYDYLMTLPVLGDSLKVFKASGGSFPTKQVDHVTYFKYGYLLFITLEPVPEAHDIFIRFAKVFEQTYTRFLDLQKAEDQTRAAQIELAVERVRAKALAMHNSSQILDVVATLRNEMLGLEIPGVVAATIYLQQEEGYIRMWDLSSVIEMEDGFHVALDVKFKLEETDPGLYIRKVWNNPANYFVEKQEDKEMAITIEWLRQYYPEQADEVQQFIDTTPWKYLLHPTIQLAQGKMSVDIMDTEPPAEMESILQKMGAAFDLAYKRFLDLQKSETQIREAQIELALERVRARTMAMQQSDELADTSWVLFKQIKDLGFETWSCGFCTWQKDDQVEVWMGADSGGLLPPMIIPYKKEPTHKDIFEASLTGEKAHDKIWEGQALQEHYAFLKTIPSVKDAIDILDQSGLSLPERQCYYVGFFEQGYLLLITKEPNDELKDLSKRFAKVFNQTYTRFLDLQKAEDQAREAKIEAALEKVRSRSLGMQKSDELKEVIQVVYEQFVQLNINTAHTGFVMDYKERDDRLIWVASKYGLPSQFTIPYFDSVYYNSFNEAKQKGWDFFATNLSFEEKDIFYKELFKHIPGIPDDDREFYFNCPGLAISTVLLENVALYIENFEGIPYSNEDNVILMRFGKVFQQTYTRFLDLQKAESQAREAQIEAALERVRSRTLAMQKSDELAETAAVLFKQLIALGIEPNRLYIAIVKDEDGASEFWITDEDGSKVSTAFATNMHENITFQNMFEGWKQKQKSLIIDMQGEELQDYFHHLRSLGVPFKNGLTQKRRLQDIAYFSNGFIGMASPDEQPGETILLLERFAAVFNLTYTRFNDLKVAEAHAIQAEEDLIKLQAEKKRAEDALTELRSTQTQLIQSEKMASLGELTAGIAHEIQNPLNFVNNFSEVSVELIKEMVDEVDKGNTGEVKEIANDLVQNLEKINHHGKRADAIVKGMLQHSRTSSSAKEPTDINKLADEYLRLAYHGLRAKDKSFNATLKTDYDETIGNINIIPQDIGRVILNLITNAFYVVKEKALSTASAPAAVKYEPTVSVITKRIDNNVEISVTDNGAGIPKNILDKIFQPFFTTKPTGQGTGLGLSLAYDIVKAHGGELKVETKEGEGTIFFITLIAI